MTEITPEALEALSQKATQGTIEVLAPETEHDHGVPLIATDYPGTFGPSNGLVLWATMLPTEIDAEDTGRAEANAEFTAALWNAYRTGQLIHAVPSGDEVEAVAINLVNRQRIFEGYEPLKDLTPLDNEDQEFWRNEATAAITALDAVRGK